MPRAEPLVFGKYRHVVDLGSGGMGDVFLAVAQGPVGFNKLQVIKRLRPELAQDPEFLGMFLNEARIAARLHHPNVVQTNEIGEQDGQHFLAMEWLDGQSLYAITRRAAVTKEGAPPSKMPLVLHLHVLAEACAGLHHAHELTDFDGTPLALVHRDISPQNVFVTYEGEVKVLDFGIAKAADSSTFTRTGVLKGKVPYMAPEQLEGQPIDRRADVFAMGAMLWEAVAGVRLWKGLNDLQIAHRLHQGEVPSPRSVDPKADARLSAVCEKALALDPERRFQTAAELQAAIEPHVARLGGARRRDLGRYVAELFREQRRKLRLKIEGELRAVVPSWRELLASGEQMALQTGEQLAMQSGEHRAADADDVELDSAEPLAAVLDAEGRRVDRVAETAVAGPAARPSVPPPSLPPSGPTSVPSGATSLPSDLVAGSELFTQRSTTMTVAPPARSSSGRALIVASIASAIVAGGVAFAVRGHRAEEPWVEPTIAATPSATPTAVSEESAPASTSNVEPAAAMPVVSIDVAPKDAKLSVDGETVAAPFERAMKPGTTHEIVVEAPGHVAKSQKLVVPIDGATLHVVLDRVNKPVAVTKPVAAPSAVPTATAKPGKPTLDQGDPWN